MSDFKLLSGFDSAFKYLKIISLIVIVLSVSGNCVIYFYSVRKIEENQRSFWLLDKKTGEVYQAIKSQQLSKEERKIEYKHMVADFYKYFYEFDQFTFEDHINKALNLIGESGKEMYEEYRRDGVMRKLQEGNQRVTVEIDSIFIDMNVNPVHGVAYVKQTTERENGKLSRHLNSKFSIYDLDAKTDENPHAAMLEDFQITDNSIIQ